MTAAISGSPGILVLGSIAFDTIETESERREMIWGGSASFAAAAASHFTSPAVIGIVGTDFPEEWIGALGDRGADTSGIARVEGPSFFWSGRYRPAFTGRDTLETRLGVFADWTPSLPPHLSSPKVAFLGNIAPGLQRRVLDQLSPGVVAAMDTMNLWLDTVPDEVEALIRRVDILLVNDEEALQMTGARHPVGAARALAAKGPSIVVVKLGAHGALMAHHGDLFQVPCYPVDRVVDPTGAGDSFAGAFLGSLAGEARIDVRTAHRALVNGAAVASWTVEHFEPRALLDLQRREIQDRFTFIRNLINY